MYNKVKATAFDYIYFLYILNKINCSELRVLNFQQCAKQTQQIKCVSRVDMDILEANNILMAGKPFVKSAQLFFYTFRTTTCFQTNTVVAATSKSLRPCFRDRTFNRPLSGRGHSNSELDWRINQKHLNRIKL